MSFLRQENGTIYHKPSWSCPVLSRMRTSACQYNPIKNLGCRRRRSQREKENHTWGYISFPLNLRYFSSLPNHHSPIPRFMKVFLSLFPLLFQSFLLVVFVLYLLTMLSRCAIGVVLCAEGGSFNAGGSLCNNPQPTWLASTLVSTFSSVKKNKCVSQLRIPLNLAFQRPEESQYI